MNYNPKGRNLKTRISEIHWPTNDSKFKERKILLEYDQPYPNHKGGGLAFGPDGHLYIGTGDGGAAGDPGNRAQNTKSLLGKMLRLDVGKPGLRPQIWATGLRNPWRFTFDPKGRLWAGDVGQNTWEEIDWIQSGHNYGWRVREGRHCFSPPQNCASQGFEDPWFEYGRAEGISITGGVVVTSSKFPLLHHRYIFADFGSGRFWAADLPDSEKASRPMKASSFGAFGIAPVAFTLDPEGDAWVADFNQGGIYRIIQMGAVGKLK